MKEYALYKGDKLITMGTIAEIAKETGVKENTLYCYKSKSYQNRSKKENNNRKILIALDD